MNIVKFQRGITTKPFRQELQFLYCARHLMILYISMKFHKNILKCFQVVKFQRGITTKLYR